MRVVVIMEGLNGGLQWPKSPPFLLLSLGFFMQWCLPQICCNRLSRPKYVCALNSVSLPKVVVTRSLLEKDGDVSRAGKQQG